MFAGSACPETCVTGNDDDLSCGFSTRDSTVTLQASINETYWVLVSGYQSNTGCYRLTVETVECLNATAATPLDGGSNYVYLEYSDSDQQSVGCVAGESYQPYDDSYGWFSVTGAGEVMTLSFSSDDYSSGYAPDVSVSVFDGLCGVPTCLASSYNSPVSFYAEAGTTYYLFVFGSDYTDFYIDVEADVVPAVCLDSSIIYIGNTGYFSYYYSTYAAGLRVRARPIVVCRVQCA